MGYRKKKNQIKVKFNHRIRLDGVNSEIDSAGVVGRRVNRACGVYVNSRALGERE